jgi:methionyl-tRNA synthetase
LTFVYRNFDGKVPEPGELDDANLQLLTTMQNTFTTAGNNLEQCNFRNAIQEIMALARTTNVYLDDKSPWKVIKEDKQAAATALYVAINVISGLKTLFYPFLPFSSQKVHEYLGFNGRVEDHGWEPHPPQPGQKLREPRPLFTKFDESIIQEETSRIGT